MKGIQENAIALCADMMYAVQHGGNYTMEKCDAFRNHRDSDKIANCSQTNQKLSTWLTSLTEFPSIEQLKSKIHALLESAGWIVYEPTDLVSVPKKFDGYMQDQLIKVGGELVTAIYQKSVDKTTHDVMTWDEFCVKSDDYNQSTYIKPATKYIDGRWNGYTAEFYWWDRLEVLPPCKWHNVGSFEVFHISERITADIVNWYARCRVTGDVYEFADRDSVTDEQILEILSNVEQ